MVREKRKNSDEDQNRQQYDGEDLPWSHAKRQDEATRRGVSGHNNGACGRCWRGSGSWMRVAGDAPMPIPRTDFLHLEFGNLTCRYAGELSTTGAGSGVNGKAL